MKKEFWIFLGCGVFFAIVAPIYWVVSPHEISGTFPLGMSSLLFFMVAFYLWFVGKEIPERPEDRNDGEIVDGRSNGIVLGLRNAGRGDEHHDGAG